MLRSKLLAACTAIVLALGFSLGGASAAMATPPAPPTPPAGVTVGDGTCNGNGYEKPANLDNINGGTGSASFDWGTMSWSGSTVSWTVNAGWTVDLCVKGGSVWDRVDIDLAVYSGSSYTHPQSISHMGYIASFTAPVATASITVIPADCDENTSLNFAGASISNATWGSPVISGNEISVTATRSGQALFDAGAGVSGDRTTKTFTFPFEQAPVGDCGPGLATAAISINDPDCFDNASTLITPDNSGSSNVASWSSVTMETEGDDTYLVITATAAEGFEFAAGEGVSADGTQKTFRVLQETVTDEDCVLPAIGVVASSEQITCEDPEGYFSFGPGVGVTEADAALIEWTVGPAAYAGNTAPGIQHAVSETVTITVTASLVESAQGDYALSDESGTGVVDPETGSITWTFEFTEASDCPEANLEGSVAYGECEGDAPYLFWEITVDNADGSVMFPTTAKLTLRDGVNEIVLDDAFPIPSADTAFSGGALWPGASVDGEGNATGWPGWAFVDGEWVVDDSNFGWVRGSDVELFIEVNPELVIDVQYPDATPDCADPAVIVPDVEFVDDCEQSNYTIFAAEGVSYTRTVNGFEFPVVFPDGADSVTFPAALLDTVTVEATADKGYRLAEDYEPWEYQFVEGFCPETGPATTAAVEFTMGECDGNSSVELTDEGGVIWMLNGEIVDGNATHSLDAGTDAEVTASLEGPSDEQPLGWTWSDPEQVTVWEESIPAADTECSPELASTGLGSLAEQLGVLAVLLTLAGMGLVIRRRTTAAQ